MTYHISFVGLLLAITVNSISSAPSSSSSLSNSDTTLNELYDNLLQREYAGPISFPDHQVERKAQRSPSLRLRFGRSDSSMSNIFPSADKRWFGDVNQKPIRSPSLRLRFGKRDDGLLRIQGFEEIDDIRDRFDRQQRKPSGRLRWGRSLPFEDLEIDNQQARTDELPIIGNESLQALLNALRELDDNEMSSREFNREIRKPAPLRLRWGRSIGTVASPSSSSTTDKLINIHDAGTAAAAAAATVADAAREQLPSNNDNENLSSTTTKLV